MKFKMYYQGGVYKLDKEKGKGKIYKIINESTPKRVDKLFSEKSSVDATLGTYYFYINKYGLQLTWNLDGIYNFLELIEDTLYDNVNLMQTVNDEGFYYYVVTMPVEDNCIRFVILDRKEAIEKAIKMANKRDIVVLAGKGHELEQEIKGKKNPFDERKIVKEIIDGLN